MFRFRPPLIAAVLAVVSIGLFASLLPRTSFVPRSSGEIVDAIGPVWPSFAVEQVIDDAPGVISEVRIWAAAGFDRGEAPISASLLRRADRQPVRQVKARLLASKVLIPYVLDFPPYELAPNEQLVLQLWVSTERENSVLFGTTEPSGDADTLPTLYGRPTDQGPLAYEVIWRGTGWRAALEGSTADLARLAGAIAAAALAFAITVLSHPFISRTLRKTAARVGTAFLESVDPIYGTLRRVWVRQTAQSLTAEAPSRLRGFYVFPWLIPAFAILHYLSNNLLLFRVSESVAVFVVAMAVVTVAFIAFRLAFKNTAIAAVITGLLGTAFFSYGHIHTALGEQADDRYLLGLGLPIVLGLGAVIARRPQQVRKIGTVFNFGSLALVATPIYRLALSLFAASSLQMSQVSQEFAGLDKRIAEAKMEISPDELPDIYYIILDTYPRSGSPADFDNDEFVHELEGRGFFVASKARSNYLNSAESIPSSLNMKYVDELAAKENKNQLYRMADTHMLGQILNTLGYQYIHVSSGWSMTDSNRNADAVVDFTPAGRVLSGPDTQFSSLFARAKRLQSKFTTALLRTTAVRPFLSHEFSTGTPRDPDAYDWEHPSRTLAWLDFMKEVGGVEGPKFVFAHLMKPHEPFSFDQYGNVTFRTMGWSSDHDPTVSEPFYGQLIWLNGKMLEVIDAILDDYKEPPIIVIAGDHGYKRHSPSIGNDILAAFMLPDGGESAIYPSITSVNHFRAILDYYFGLDLGLLEDSVYYYQP